MCAFALAACSRSSPRGDAAVPPPLLTANTVEFPHESPQLNAIRTAEARPFAQGEESFTGQLIWNEDVTNRVFSPVAGRVEKIIAEIGAHVDKGDDLAILRSPDFGQAEADYHKAVSDLAQAEKALARVSTLREHGAAAVKDVESAQADRDRAVAEKQRAESRLQLLGSPGGEFSDQYHVVAPISGVVVDRNINIGQEVRSDIVLAGSPQLVAPMFTITDPTKLWVQLDVPDRELNKLRVGEPVELRTAAYPDRLFNGRIDVIGAALDPQTRVAHARASVDNGEALLKSAMYVGVNVKDLTPSQTEVVVPARAVIFLDGKYFVFVETAERKFEKREVAVSRDLANGMMAISGVNAGTRVVSEGGLLLNDMLADVEEAAPEKSPGHS